MKIYHPPLFVSLVSLGNMSNCHFMLHLPILLCHLKLFIVIYGLLLFEVVHDINIIFFFWMTTLISCGPYPLEKIPSILDFFFHPLVFLLRHNLKRILSVFNVTMGKSSTMSLSKNFATKMVLFFNFHAFTLLQKMEKLNEKYEP